MIKKYAGVANKPKTTSFYKKLKTFLDSKNITDDLQLEFIKDAMKYSLELSLYKNLFDLISEQEGENIIDLFKKQGLFQFVKEYKLKIFLIGPIGQGKTSFKNILMEWQKLSESQFQVKEQTINAHIENTSQEILWPQFEEFDVILLILNGTNPRISQDFKLYLDEISQKVPIEKLAVILTNVDTNPNLFLEEAGINCLYWSINNNYDQNLCKKAQVLCKLQDILDVLTSKEFQEWGQILKEYSQIKQ